MLSPARALVDASSAGPGSKIRICIVFLRPACPCRSLPRIFLFTKHPRLLSFPIIASPERHSGVSSVMPSSGHIRTTPGTGKPPMQQPEANQATFHSDRGPFHQLGEDPLIFKDPTSGVTLRLACS
ncbi:hypothetical protein LshimejAT787_1403240 [Lyophyllum shimeji]|uniref:Uncharacterized protein n=1 Tax=Lyophyllum shimeji TaxID=47721 RepID=A0A9P3UT40_LYOSH|nr:hypothetical protein LshimejAT787_1403240 [Lyophyllum shimeji]